jgi:hypothetical protein
VDCNERTLSATIGPLVALVSAAITTPPSKRHPTMVVPVLVALGSGTPWACRAALRLWLLKSKPAMMVVCVTEDDVVVEILDAVADR